MILIRKNSSFILGCLTITSKNSTFFSSPHFLTPLSLFTSKVDDPSPKSLFIVDYLINSVGLLSEEATKASKLITHIKSRLQPDSVLEFFRKNGFTNTDIKRIISIHSRLLCAKVDSTLKPKIEGLRDLGFSEAQITKLVTANPFSLNYLNYCNVRPRIEFLSDFLGSNDDLVKAFSYDISLLSSRLEKKLKPNISFLRECQVSNERIGSLMTKDQKIMGRSLNSLKSIAKRVVELGVPFGSGIFFHAFRCLCKINSDLVDAKLKLLGSLGFSRAELFSVVSKQPTILGLSEKNLSETVDFLIKEVGCELSYVSNYPSMVCLSLTKRLIPRNYVLQLIKQKGLLKKKTEFYYIASISEKRFVEQFIFSFKDKMPELHDIYLSASAGKFLN